MKQTKRLLRAWFVALMLDYSVHAFAPSTTSHAAVGKTFSHRCTLSRSPTRTTTTRTITRTRAFGVSPEKKGLDQVEIDDDMDPSQSDSILDLTKQQQSINISGLVSSSDNKLQSFSSAAEAAEQDNIIASNEIEESRGYLQKLKDLVRKALKQLATLSLKDYKWRSSVFEKTEADRLVEQSLAVMRGSDPGYVRPMDATDEKIGPLGVLERDAVGWLRRVIEEEGRRAEKIAASQGDLIRPIAMEGNPGPLADLEQQAVDFVKRISESERERFASGVVRPKDMDESVRGPLGNAEASVYDALVEIQKAEIFRSQLQQRQRQEQQEGTNNSSSSIVRPIDVPGPLGDFERAVVALVTAERERAKENRESVSLFLRPKDASLPGPLGEAEFNATQAVERFSEEERERLRNIQRVLQENRPMETNRNSFLGLAEALVVGLLRAPRLVMSVVGRVRELLAQEEEKEMAKDIQSPSSRPNAKETPVSKEIPIKLELPPPVDDDDDLIGEFQ